MGAHGVIQRLELLPWHPHWIVFFVASRLGVLERRFEGSAVQVELSVLILVLHLVLHCCVLLERMLFLCSLPRHEVLSLLVLVLRVH